MCKHQTYVWGIVRGFFTLLVFKNLDYFRGFFVFNDNFFLNIIFLFFVFFTLSCGFLKRTSTRLGLATLFLGEKS
jgi:hypothetical protein